MPFRKVLIALDDDPIAVHAARTGVELARVLGAEMALVCVMDRSAAEAAAPEIPRDELLAEARDHAVHVITEWVPKLVPGGAVQTFTPEGRPAREIVDAARVWSADLIVIGSHGRGGLTHALLGSVAEAVMRHAHCPVLVVRRAA